MIEIKSASQAYHQAKEILDNVELSKIDPSQRERAHSSVKRANKMYSTHMDDSIEYIEDNLHSIDKQMHQKKADLLNKPTSEKVHVYMRGAPKEHRREATKNFLTSLGRDDKTG